MKTSRWIPRIAAIVVLLSLSGSLILLPSVISTPAQPAGVRALAPQGAGEREQSAAAGTASPRPSGPVTVSAAAHGESRPLRELTGVRAAPSRMSLANESEALPKNAPNPNAPQNLTAPALVQTQVGKGAFFFPGVSFEGVSNADNINTLGYAEPGYYPPDTNGDVGPNNYVQWVNVGLAVYDKSGHLLLGPLAGNALFTSLGGECASNNDGDPIVLYDARADRWFLSQFSIGSSYNGPFHQCIAVSKTGDPTGAYWLYDFLWSNTIMNDYPHFGVWSDGYYMSVNQFDSTTSFSWAGAGVAVFERSAMLNGAPARMISFDENSVNSKFISMLPASLDGRNPPPAGAPDIFAEWDAANTVDNSSPDAVRLWNFHADWTNPLNSTFGQSGQPNLVIPTGGVTAFGYISSPTQCNSCELAYVPQPGTSIKLDTLSDRIMHRLQYRNFGSYQTLLSDHTVSVSGSAGQQSGIHWFELRNTGGAGWGLYQDGVFAPPACSAGDSSACWRWMGSMAMNGQGQIAMGYSLSSAGSTYPSIAVSGRMPWDQPGTMRGEQVVINGSGSQVGIYARWGDYSMLSVDPTDDTTFWYTNEYLTSAAILNDPTNTHPWQTRIFSFKLADLTYLPNLQR